ncbi:MAG TPA: hypothetical protein VIN93_09870 [Bryobacteraceae bacterium]|jgi:hypothetical protein
MHPRRATLISFFDAEAGAERSRRVARHLAKCEKCRNQLRGIERERHELSACAAAPAIDNRQGLAGVRSAMATWQQGRNGAAASELKGRLRWQIETYFGSPALSVVERPGMRPEELLGKAGEILDVFLGPDAAEAVRDDVFRGLEWAGPTEETCR